MNIDYGKIIKEDAEFSAYLDEFFKYYLTLPDTQDTNRTKGG